MIALVHTTRRLFCDLTKRNRKLIKRINKYNQELNIHQTASKITQQKMDEFVTKTSRQKIAFQMAKKTDYDKELKDFISKFNIKHKNRISLLDFSQYTTQLGDLKDKQLTKDDIQLIKQFQKRKVDQKIQQWKEQITNRQNIEFPQQTEYKKTNLRNFSPEKIQKQEVEQQKQKQKQKQNQQGEEEQWRNFPDEVQLQKDLEYQQGPFKIKDQFTILLLNQKTNTKVTTLNRIQSYKTLLFMGNGNGLISYAKGSGYTPGDSLNRAMTLLKKNIIAIPMDSRCTLPLQINKRFQDYRIYIRPVPGFNSHGHPIISFMLTLAGIDHCGFHVAHTKKNVYNVLKVFYKAITTNTTPKQLSEREGFKVYRHQFIRPLTYQQTHHPVAGKAKVRMYDPTQIIKHRLPTEDI